MSFSRGQQPELRGYLALAWAAHCRAAEIAPEERCKGKRCHRCNYCRWYEAVLCGATGKCSTTMCNAGRDYDFFMSALEEIHGGGIKWQMKASGGDANRILHDVRKLWGGASLTEEYLCKIGAQALRLEELPPLHSLTHEQLIVIRRAAKQHVVRKQVALAEKEPQISAKTKVEKPPQVRSFYSALQAQSEPEPGEVDAPF